MNRAPRLLALAGSTRRDSFNKRLVHIAAEGARAAGAEVTLLDLAHFPMPLFDQDLEGEGGMPSQAVQLKHEFLAHDGLILASPEYNSSITGVLKNAIDWISRPQPDEPSLVAFTGKTAVLMSASPGALGGLRGLVHVRDILGNIGMLVLPDQVAVPRAHEAFAEDGTLNDARQQKSIAQLGRRLAEVTAKMIA